MYMLQDNDKFSIHGKRHTFTTTNKCPKLFDKKPLCRLVALRRCKQIHPIL